MPVIHTHDMVICRRNKLKWYIIFSFRVGHCAVMNLMQFEKDVVHKRCS